MIEKTLRQYSILSHLGDGGMGTVYYGKNTNLDQEVAIKVLHPHLARDVRLMERFKFEAQIQAQLSHPNIVRVTDFIQEGSDCAIVMEYVQGDTFDKILEKHGKPLSVRQVVDLFLPLLAALDFAHSQGVIHRDLKPNNLILKKMYGNRIPMIMDFGVARAMGNDKRLTVTGTKMGSPFYMSPEQALAKPDIDHRTDIYSMAISIYEMVSGRVPFNRESDYALVEAIIHEPPPSIGNQNPTVSKSFELALMKGMSKYPQDRYSSSAMFSQSLLLSIKQKTPPPQQQHDTETPRQTHSPPVRPAEAAQKIVQKPTSSLSYPPSPPPFVPAASKSKFSITYVLVFLVVAFVVIIAIMVLSRNSKNGILQKTAFREQKLYVHNPNGINVRSEPSASSRVMGKICHGERVSAIKKSQSRTNPDFSYYLITAPSGLEGWAYAGDENDWMQSNGPPSLPSKTIGNTYNCCLNKAGFINLRESPGKHGKVITTIQNGQKINILDKVRSQTDRCSFYYKVRTTTGRNGYLYAGSSGEWIY